MPDKPDHVLPNFDFKNLNGEIVMKKTYENDKIFYSMVQKQSESGISFNKRILFLKDQHAIGYISQPNINFDVKNAKVIIPLAKLKLINSKDNLLIIKFQIQNKTNNKQPEFKTWVFRLTDAAVAQSWADLINYEVGQLPSRKSTLSKQQSNESLQRTLSAYKNKRSQQSPDVRIKNNSQHIIKSPQQQPIANQRPELDYNSMKKSPTKYQQESPSRKSKTINKNPSHIMINESQIKLFQPKQSITNSPSNNQYDTSYVKISSQNYEQSLQKKNIYLNLFSTKKQFTNNIEKTSFINYFRPIYKLTSSPLSYLEEVNQKYLRFIEYCQNNVKQLIDKYDLNQYRLEEQNNQESISQSQVSRSLQTSSIFSNFKVSQSQNIVYYQLEDIKLKIGLSQLKSLPSSGTGQSPSICDQSLLKIFQKKIKNLNYVYRRILQDELLCQRFIIPMHLCVEYKGFTVFIVVKIQNGLSLYPQNFLKKQTSINNISTEALFQRLAQKLNVKSQVFQNQQIIKFSQIKQTKNASSPTNYIIQEVNILPHLQKSTILRQNVFIQLYDKNLQKIQNNEQSKDKSSKKKFLTKEKYFNHLGTKKQNETHLKLISQSMQSNINKLLQNLQKFQYPFIHPIELSSLLHQYGINIKQMGKICKITNNAFMKSIIKSEIAARCCKYIFRKKMQQLVLGLKRSQKQINKTATSLLNIFLGNGQQSSLLWKVVTLHAQIMFDISVSTNQLSKGYFFLSLVHNLKISIWPSECEISKIFDTSNFVQKIQFRIQSKPTNILPPYLQILSQLNSGVLEQQSQIIVQKLKADFCLQKKDFLYFIRQNKNLYNKMMNLLSIYVGPNNLQHLNLYSQKNLSNPSTQADNFLLYFRRRISELKWMIKENIDRNFIDIQAENILKQIKIYYQYHPFFEQVYELLALKYTKNQEYLKALEINKIALTNMINVCGGNNNHVKLANNYFNLASAYTNLKKIDEALSQLKRAKHCLQISLYSQKVEYALILNKIASLNIYKKRDTQALQILITCCEILQKKQNFFQYFENLIDSYEMIDRCITSEINMKRNTKITKQQHAQRCIIALENICKKQKQADQNLNDSMQSHDKESFEYCDVNNFSKVLRIFLPYYFSFMSQSSAFLFSNYLIEICDDINKKGISKYQTKTGKTHNKSTIIFYPSNSSQSTNVTFSQEEAVNYLRNQLCQGNFSLNLQQYIQKTDTILNSMKESIRLSQLKPLNQTSSEYYSKNKNLLQVKKYDSFMRSIVVLCGDGFMMHIFDV